jgi:hypothetical protein
VAGARGNPQVHDHFRPFSSVCASRDISNLAHIRNPSFACDNHGKGKIRKRICGRRFGN